MSNLELNMFEGHQCNIWFKPPKPPWNMNWHQLINNKFQRKPVLSLDSPHSFLFHTKIDMECINTMKNQQETNWWVSTIITHIISLSSGLWHPSHMTHHIWHAVLTLPLMRTLQVTITGWYACYINIGQGILVPRDGDMHWGKGRGTQCMLIKQRFVCIICTYTYYSVNTNLTTKPIPILYVIIRCKRGNIHFHRNPQIVPQSYRKFHAEIDCICWGLKSGPTLTLRARHVCQKSLSDDFMR